MWMFNLIIQVQSDEPVRSSYGRKAVNWKPLNRMANIYKMWLCEESLKTPSSRPILIYFEFRSKRSLITVIWMDPHSPKKFIATKYCFLILGDNTSFFFFIFRFYVMLCYVIYFVIINFCKNCFLSIVLFIIIYYYYFINIFIKFINYFFIKKYFNFFMFRDVPCSWFYRRPLLARD